MVTQTVTGTESQPTSFEAKVAAAKYGDLAAYAKAVYGLEFEPYQEAWAEALESENRLLIICPPVSGKSTLVRLWAERAIGLNPDIRILWLMNSGEQAQKQVMTASQNIASNNVYQAAFSVKPDKDAQWTKSVLYVKRSYIGPDPTLMATGFNGPYQGLHFDVIVIDDPTNPEDVRSPTTMESQRDKLRGVILDRLVENGRIVGILTRWGEEDLVATLEAMGFTSVVMPILADYPWGPTLSNKLFPMRRVESIRVEKSDERLFTLTYMCDAVGAAEGEIIKREHLCYWTDADIPDKPLQFFVGIDPAASKKTSSDRTAIATVGTDPTTRKIYLTDMWAAHVDVPTARKEINNRCKKIAGLRAVGLETVGFQLSMLQDMKRMYQLPFKEIPYRTRRLVQHRAIGIDRDKVGRAMYLEALFTSGRLYLPRYLPLVDGVSLEAELCKFPRGKMDDRMDALSFACVLADAACPRHIRVRVLGGF